jgi:hypothetical protein
LRANRHCMAPLPAAAKPTRSRVLTGRACRIAGGKAHLSSPDTRITHMHADRLTQPINCNLINEHSSSPASSWDGATCLAAIKLETHSAHRFKLF